MRPARILIYGLTPFCAGAMVTGLVLGAGYAGLGVHPNKCQSSLLTQRHHPELADGFGVVHSASWERSSQLHLCKRKAIHFKLIYPRGHPRVHREINHPRKLDAQLARHGSPLPARAGSVNSED